MRWMDSQQAWASAHLVEEAVAADVAGSASAGAVPHQRRGCRLEHLFVGKTENINKNKLRSSWLRVPFFSSSFFYSCLGVAAHAEVVVAAPHVNVGGLHLQRIGQRRRRHGRAAVRHGRRRVGVAENKQTNKQSIRQTNKQKIKLFAVQRQAQRAFFFFLFFRFPFSLSENRLMCLKTR